MSNKYDYLDPEIHWNHANVLPPVGSRMIIDVDGKAELIDDRLSWYVSCCGCDTTVIGDRVPEPETEADLDAIDWNMVKQSATESWNTRRIPEGYQLVPIEPTEAMEKAGSESLRWYDYAEDAADVYKAMIKAAGDRDE